MESVEFGKKVLKILERIAKAVEKIADTEEVDEESRPVKGFDVGGTD